METEKRPEINPEPDLATVVKLWWRRRKPIALGAAGGMLLGLAVALLWPKAYTASVKMVAETERAGISSELSGLTSLVGINLNTLRPDENLNAELYPDIVASAPFLIELSALRIDGKPLSVHVPGFRDEAARFEGNVPANRSSYKLLELLRKSISVYTDKKSGLTTVSVTLNDPLAAAVTADSLVARLERYIVASRTRKAREDFGFTEARFEEAEANYYNAQEAYARFSDANQHTVRESAAIERNRLYNEQQLAYAVYSQLASQLELARIKVQEQTPVLTVIEPALVPVRHSAPRRSLIVLAGLLLGAAIPMAYLFGKLFFKEE